MKLLELMRQGALTTAARENSKNSGNSNSKGACSDIRNNSFILKKNKNSNISNNSSYSYPLKGKGKPEHGLVAIAILANPAIEAEAVEYLRNTRPLPYLDLDGGLVIPFNADSRYHYWAGGQSLQETTAQLKKSLLH